MKIRILNGGHAAIAYPAALLDIEFVHDAMQDEDIRAFLNRLVRQEIIPIVSPVTGMVLDSYFDTIVSRFSNPKIGDTIPRLAQDGSNRHPKFILPSTRDRLRRGEGVVGLSLVTALWCRYLGGYSDRGTVIDVRDERAEVLQPAASLARTQPMKFLGLASIFGELSDDLQFQIGFGRALENIIGKGTRATLQSYVRGDLGQ